jgi:hypothetical protein
MPRAPREQTLGTWGLLTTTVTPEVTRGLPHLEYARAKLVATEAEANQLVLERDYHQAQRQEATRKLQIALEEGNRTAHALRLGLGNISVRRTKRSPPSGCSPFAAASAPRRRPLPTTPRGMPATRPHNLPASRPTDRPARPACPASSTSRDAGKASFPPYRATPEPYRETKDGGKDTFPPYREASDRYREPRIEGKELSLLTA